MLKAVGSHPLPVPTEGPHPPAGELFWPPGFAVHKAGASGGISIQQLLCLDEAALLLAAELELSPGLEETKITSEAENPAHQSQGEVSTACGAAGCCSGPQAALSPVHNRAGAAEQDLIPNPRLKAVSEAELSQPRLQPPPGYKPHRKCG